MEYLLIVALTFAVIVPTTYLFFNFSRESNQEISDSQITRLGKSIIDSAESIYYSGQGSKTVLELNIPENIHSVQIIDGRELIFNLSTSQGTTEIVFFSKANLTAANCIGNNCTIPELAGAGTRSVKIEAITQNSVRISAT